MMSDYLFAAALTLAAGLSTAIGGLVVLKRKEPSAGFLAAALGFSAGVMLWVSFLEIIPGARASLAEEMSEPAAEWLTLMAVFAGVGVIALIDRLVPAEVNPHEPAHDGVISPNRLRKMGVMMALAIGIHNFPEGFATFLAALEDPKIAVPVAVAIAIHNIPEGISVAIPLWQATGSRMKGLKWATLTGFAEPLGALVGMALLLPFMGPLTLGIAFGAIAGIMLFISLDELLPTAVATGKHHAAIYGLIVGMMVMAASLAIA